MKDTAWENFKTVARLEKTSQVPVALIVDSPWLPGYAGIDTREYFLYPERWLEINKRLLIDFPGIVWIPGFWVEYGMAIEPSAFGARLHFHADRPPSVEPVYPDLDFWAQVKPANPNEDGLMPLVLFLNRKLDQQLSAEGLGIRMAAARGPLTTASWLVGVTQLMEGMLTHPEQITRLLETITTTLIDWLQAQLDAISQPQGVLLLDDLVGMVSRRTYQAMVAPHLQRIFRQFEGLLRVYHNDTPCMHLMGDLTEAGFQVLNFSHELPLADVIAKTQGKLALMGNVPPLQIGVFGSPEQVYQAATECLKNGVAGHLILSFGGGVSPGTPPENIAALWQAAQDWGTSAAGKET
ncbi:MAG: uroporphyrinogen decarboxylase family protein [Chloroflexota bacterium]